MSTDDRFLPQGKQILAKICQVRPMPYAYAYAYVAIISSEDMVGISISIRLLGREGMDKKYTLRMRICLCLCYGRPH